MALRCLRADETGNLLVQISRHGQPRATPFNHRRSGRRSAFDERPGSRLRPCARTAVARPLASSIGRGFGVVQSAVSVISISRTWPDRRHGEIVETQHCRIDRGFRCGRAFHTLTVDDAGRGAGFARGLLRCRIAQRKTTSRARLNAMNGRYRAADPAGQARRRRPCTRISRSGCYRGESTACTVHSGAPAWRAAQGFAGSTVHDYLGLWHHAVDRILALDSPRESRAPPHGLASRV